MLAFLRGRPAGRRLGRPDAVPLGADRQRRGPRRRARLDPARAAARRADDRPAVRRRARHRRVSTVFFDVAYQSYLPALVDREALVEGNAKLQASESVAQIAGPGVGGVLIQALTAPYAVLVDAVELPLVGALGRRAIRARPPEARAQARPPPGSRDRRGAAFVLGNRLLRSIAMCTGTSNLFSNVAFAVFFVLLARELHLSRRRHRPDHVDRGDRRPARLAGRRPDRAPARSGADDLDSASLSASRRRSSRRSCTATGRSSCSRSRSSSCWGCVVVYNITQVSFRQGLRPPAPARPDERDDALPRVGDDAARRASSAACSARRSGCAPTLLVAAIGGTLRVRCRCSCRRCGRCASCPRYVSDGETAGPLAESAA